MRAVFAFIAGATLAGLLLSWVMRPKPCTCPAQDSIGGDVRVIPPVPPRMGKPPETILL